MTSKEFVIWLKGFTDGVHEYSITPKQWDYLKEKLAEVSDEPKIGTPIGTGGWGTPNTAPFVPLPHITPPPTDPYNPYKVTCGTSGSTWIPNVAVTTTPGTGYITTYNPIQFGSGSWHPSSITYSTGSAWSYTTSNEKIF